MEKLKLKEVIDAIDSVSRDTQVFYSPKKKEFIYQGSYFDDFNEMEEGEEYDDDLISLPDSYEINEYRMMEDFIDTIEDVRIANCLTISLQGQGAFRRFKDMCINLDLIDKWYEFKNEKLKKMAIEWCEEHKLAYE